MEAYCDVKRMTVTIVGQDMGCGQNLYIVGLTQPDIGKPLNRWKTCNQTWQKTNDDNVEWCSYDCDCSGVCEQVMLLRWPVTISESSWTLCDISEQCNDVCDEKYEWRFRESCYHLSPKKKNQHDAVTYCNSLGAELITIETMDEFEYIRMRLESSDADSTWVSATRINGTFFWITGAELEANSTMWSENQPDNWEVCVEIRCPFHYYVNDIPCDSGNHPLCEFQP
ncbi:hypothetical protein LSH36_160g05008 [Paralvinella palmiformis]|uniref:C-type lectin domain-containing protein n=1 Tax=Paralvinella palmiformis TaxID=53620 RepID=A0AAD9JTG5_9ANNE|nr:hypothetical protein LSH36_160g05008 [Paralvinella palmiformis]